MTRSLDSANYVRDYIDNPLTDYFHDSISNSNDNDILDDTTNNDTDDMLQDLSNQTQQQRNLAENPYIGTTPQDDKEDYIYRVYGANTNGFNIGRDGADFSEFCEEMRQLEVDTWCTFELNLDTLKPRVRDIMQTTIRKHFDHSKMTTSTSSISLNRRSNFKPGGTLIATQGHTCGRVIHQGRDNLGRWSYQVLSCKNRRTLTIVSAYQVCQQQIVTNNRVISSTASAQQTSLLRQQGRQENPRQAFVQDLQTFLQQRLDEDSELLILGDFNEPLTGTMDGMTKLCSNLQLSDLMAQVTGTETDFGTHVRGHQRIDYALCTELVAQSAVRGCYEPFGQRGKGDHRNMLLDFDTRILFGNLTQALGPISTREFSAKDRSAVRTYILSKHKYLQEHNFEHRLNDLEDHWSPESMERLDADFQRAGKVAANQCIKKPRHVAYVKELADLRQKKNILLKLISEHKLKRSFESGIAHLTRHGCSFRLPTSLEDCIDQCKATQTRIQELTRDAATKRQKEQQIALETAQAQGDKQTVKAIKHRLAAERTKAMFNKIRQYRGTQKTGITRLEVPTDSSNMDYERCTEWITIDTPAEIESRLLQRNQKHFGQAEGTFPTQQPFSEWVDWGASSHTAELILEGAWESSELDELQQCLLRHMERRTELDTITDIITVEEWRGKIQSWPETTTTSPSGFHLSHSKALLAAHDLDPETEEAQELEKKRNELIEWQVKLLNGAIKNRYSLERWQKIVNVMILKEPGNIKIHRLRVIHLYEQDYNLLLAVKWRKLIQHGAKHQLLHNSQFGAVPGRDAVLPTLIEEFQYEISRASKRPMVHLDYDATACYDRIVMSFGGLASRSFGQHRSVVFINAKTLEEARYYLKTQLGVSDRFYKHCTIYPIYGSGQGAGNSPAIWCVISSILFETYDEKAHGATFYSPDRKTIAQVLMIGFVDDTSGSVNDFLLPVPAQPDHYVQLATDDAQRWNDLLSLSGGSLNQRKCSYHFLYYDFTIDGLPFLTSGRFGPTITITSNFNTNPIKQLSAYDSHKTLGVYKAPSSTDNSQFLALKKKNHEHARVVASSPLTRTDVWAYYHAIYLPSMTYVFPSSSLSVEHCEQLQKDFKKVFLPKYGYNRHTPNAVVFGSSEYGGLGLRTLSVERGIAQIYGLLACLRSNGVASQLAIIMLSWGQLLAGTSVPILLDPSIAIPHLDPMTWIPVLRESLHGLRCSIELHQSFTPQLQREQDIFIMDRAIELFPKPLELQLLNACRVYLGLLLLSDMVTPEGGQICQFALQGYQSTQTQPKLLFPYQQRPGRRAWKLWKQFLRSFITPGTTCNLQTPLGRWKVTGPSLNREWNKYLLQEQRLLLVRSTETSRFRLHAPTWDQRGFIATDQEYTVLPSSALPVFTTQQNDVHILARLAGANPPDPSPLPPTTFSRLLTTLDLWEQELLQGVTFLCPIETIRQVFELHISDNSFRLHLCGDGSVVNFTGSFGGSCADDDGKRLIHLKGPAPGYRSTSYRTESYAFLAWLRLVFRLCELWGCSLPSNLVFYSDSKSMLDTIQQRLDWTVDYPYTTMSPDWDLHQAITSTLRRFPELPHCCHVKGHQDRYHAFEELSLPAQLNVEADELASQYRYPSSTSATKVSLVEGTVALLHGPDGTITANYRAALRRCYNEPLIREHICNKHEWTHDTWQLVDWTSHCSAVRAHFSRRHFLSKFLHNWLPLGSLISRYDDHYVDHCASCSGNVFEDRDHFLRCPARRSWIDKLMDDLKTFWNEQSVDAALTDLLTSAIHSWLDSNPVSFDRLSPSLARLVAHQTMIGWDQLFLGRFASTWSSLQDLHLESLGLASSFVSGRVFVTGTIKLLFSHTHSLWLRRNEDVHGRDAASRESAAFALAQRQIRLLYAHRHSVPPEIQQTFYSTPDEHFQLHTTSSSLQAWLATWAPVILRTTTLPHSSG